MEQKSIEKNPHTKRCITKTKMDEEEDKGVTITFGKINIVTFPRYYQIKNRFQICRRKQQGDPCRHPKSRTGEANYVCAIVVSLDDGFAVMTSEEKQ